MNYFRKAYRESFYRSTQFLLNWVQDSKGINPYTIRAFESQLKLRGVSWD